VACAVDNEFMQKKSLKKWCIFQKEKPFDDDSNQGREGEKRKKKKTLNIVL